MRIAHETLRAGDWVEVNSPVAIAETLDGNGALDGLPFMPEMRQYCGQRFRVLRLATKACVEYPTRYWIRELRNNDVVLLDGLRCSGDDHDGCQRACTLYWKAAWIRKVDGPGTRVAASPVPGGNDCLSRKLKTMQAPGRYFCQSTEMANATRPLSKLRIFANCVAELRSGSRSLPEMAWVILAPMWRKATAMIPRARLAGDLKRTPLGNLQLQPGELVQIKTAAEIARTLDAKGRNRGLICDYGMCQFSGGQYRVRNRLDKMISEPTGEMRKVEGTVILEGLNCLCWNVVGGCPRDDFMYWREIWLERLPVDGGQRTNEMDRA
jgi:hypothetical protein